jgi:excisionase family DNA binding protein
MTPRRTTSGKPTKDAGKPEKLMTVIQLAEHWQLSPRTIRRMITQGLPVLRFGRAVRIHPKVVAEFNSQPRHRNLDADTDGQ